MAAPKTMPTDTISPNTISQERISLDTIDELQLPDLEDCSAEEALYAPSEPRTHQDHKLVEAHAHTLALAKQRIRTLEIENDDLALLGPHRRRYSWWILGFVMVFVATTFMVLLSSAIQVSVVQNGESFYRSLIVLDNDVLMTLLATNTVQVVGLLYVVAKWLFPTKTERKAVEDSEPSGSD